MNKKQRIDLSERGKRDGELTTMQRMFCDFYVTSRNNTKSYVKAFYEAQGRPWTKDDLPTIREKAYQLRKDPKIKKYIAESISDMRESDAMTPDDIVLKWTQIVNDPASDMKDILKASELLAKHYKMLAHDSDLDRPKDVVINLTQHNDNPPTQEDTKG